MTVSTISQEAISPAVQTSNGPRRNQSWVLRNGHAVTATIGSVLKLKCSYCNVFVSYNNYSSSPMKRHLETRHMIHMRSPRRGEVQFSSDLMNLHFHTSIQFSTERLRDLLLDMLIDCKLPFQIVERVSFRALLDYLHSCTPGQMIIPSGDTVRNQLLRMYELKSIKIKDVLSRQRWISYTADLWTSPWKVPYFGVTAHWINDDWKKEEVKIAFNRVEGRHTGAFYTTGHQLTTNTNQMEKVNT
jgi:hypothetical protein